MKLNDTRPNIETSGELEEQFFSIEDQGMIFDILRNKMYSNPILAICREITCNARDAHREIGKPDLPIHIQLPNRLESFFKIKDFGPGISPDRMSNIFIKYTASTKRNDNIQTGGFGLGAKTPFSYSDTFTIITIFNGIKYNYACFIDETKVGKLALLSEEPTDQPNGTEIIIPVKSQDYRYFAEWTEVSTRHWDVKPEITGDKIEYKKIKKVIDNADWAIVQADYYSKEIKCIIDGIEYPVDLNALKTYADTKLIYALRGSIYLYFGVGELSLSASREQIYLDKMTQKKLCDRLDEMLKSIKQQLTNKFETFQTFWDANVYYRKELSTIFSDTSIFGSFTWKGLQLLPQYIDLGCDVFLFTKGKYSHRYNIDPDKLTRSNQYKRMSFYEDCELFINDLPLKEPTPRHIKKAFDDNPKLKYLQVIVCNDTVTEDLLNKKINLDKMMPRRLSEITKSSSRKTSSQSISRLLVYKYDSAVCSFRQVPCSNLEEDDNSKILAILVKDSNGLKRVKLDNGNYFSTDFFSVLSRRFPKYSFYGVDDSLSEDRIKKKFGDISRLDDFLKEKVINGNVIDYNEIKYALQNCYGLDERNIESLDRYKKLIKNSDSFFIKRLNLHKKIHDIARSSDSLLSIYECINGQIAEKALQDYIAKHPELNVDAHNRKYLKVYPLMNHVSTYYSEHDKLIEHIAQYINLIDSTI